MFLLQIRQLNFQFLFKIKSNFLKVDFFKNKRFHLVLLPVLCMYRARKHRETRREQVFGFTATIRRVEHLWRVFASNKHPQNMHQHVRGQEKLDRLFMEHCDVL